MQRLKMKKGSVWVYLTLLGAVLALLLFTRNLTYRHNATAGTNNPQDTLVVGMQISHMGVCTNGDTLGGFFYEVMKGMARQENIPVRIEGFAQISTALERLSKNEYDIVVGDIPMTSELKERYLFTDPIHTDRQVLLQRREESSDTLPVASVNALRGQTVHVAEGSPYIGRIRNLSHEIGDTIIIVEEKDYSPELLGIQVALGEIPNAVVSEQLARSLSADYPQLDYSIPISFNQFQSWAIDADNRELLDSVNNMIGRFAKSPQFETITARYLSN